MTSTEFGWRHGKVTRAYSLTASARSITFDVPGWSGSEAGQHVDVRLTAPDGYQATRSYSLARAGDLEEIELAVQRLPDGEVSPFLVDDLELDDRVELRGPLGKWFVWRADQTQPVQLIAGGSGVVPLVAMMRAHAEARSTVSMQLLYSLRSPAEALYDEELRRLAPYARTTMHYTRELPAGWRQKPGRLDPASLELHSLPPERRPVIYICGPTGFVESVSTQLTALGHNPADIRTERFGGS